MFKGKVIYSLLLVALVAALVGGATMAVFTSTDSNTANNFQAGTVIVTAGDIVTSSTINITNMAPGDVYEGSFTVANAGSLELYFDTQALAIGTLFEGTTPAVVTFTPENAVLAPGGSTVVNFSVNFPLAADNSYQGAAGSVQFAVNAVQTANHTYADYNF
ncbi:MAG: TasA family protein [Bacillota bacterium]|nr:TasA family protein [Bacillota bacterium]MDW7684205.1 TasA family protein [Bacillota bacterium]